MHAYAGTATVQAGHCCRLAAVCQSLATVECASRESEQTLHDALPSLVLAEVLNLLVHELQLLLLTPQLLAWALCRCNRRDNKMFVTSDELL